jgi:hypothetical protein
MKWYIRTYSVVFFFLNLLASAWGTDIRVCIGFLKKETQSNYFYYCKNVEMSTDET